MCGNAGGAELALTVYPLILRGISIVGIDSVNGSQDNVDLAWQQAALDWNRAQVAHMIHTIPLSDVPSTCADLLNGLRIGRTVVTL